MKQFLLIIALCLLLTSIVLSQPYVRGGLGYGLSLGSSLIGRNATSSGTETNYEGVYGSYGAGLNFGAAFGYSFTSNFKGELEVSYVLGNKYEVTSSGDNKSTTDNDEASMITLTPGIIIMTDAGDIKPYAKLGFVIAFPQRTTEDEYFRYNDDKKYTMTNEYSGNMAIGFTGGGGLFYPISDQMMLFGEVSFTNIAWEPAEADVSSNEPNFVKRTIKYKKEYTSSADNTMISKPLPMGSVGLKIGILLNF